MKLVIIKYNSGNVTSVRFALQRLGAEALWTDDKNEILTADKVIFPGVGNAASAMKSVTEKGLDKIIPQLKQPFLGICAGMQLMCAHSEEGGVNCLGIVPLQVKKFPSSPLLKVPHTGWNTIHKLQGPLFKGVEENSYVYFVHSYFAESGNETIASCQYGNTFTAALQKDNFYGVQFHTELSAKAGSIILQNFLNL